MNLTDFLLARIAEDERAAQDAERTSGGSWHPVGLQSHFDARMDDHIARFDPARVLAGCEAKREIVAACVETLATEGSGFPNDDRGYDEAHSLAGFTLRALALPHADHPDYLAARRP